MGYDVHITRGESWSKNDSHPITLEDWLAYVQSDCEFRLEGVAVATAPQGEVIRMDAPGLAKWTSGSDGTIAWFDYRRNRISVKNPTRQTLVKMFQVAVALGGRVQGDEEEIYDSLGNS